MAKKEKWLQDAVPKSHRGVFTAKAKKAGKSVAQYAQEKKNSSDPTLRGEAKFALRAQKGFKKGGSVEAKIDEVRNELHRHESMPAHLSHKGLASGGHVSMSKCCMKIGGFVPNKKMGC